MKPNMMNMHNLHVPALTVLMSRRARWNTPSARGCPPLRAHHDRLWNRELAIRLMVPRNDRRWARLSINNTRVPASLAVIAHLLQCVALGSAWADRGADFFDAYASVPTAAMCCKPRNDVREVLGSFIS